jgi:membrane protein involved in colicin uptake
MAKNQNRIKPIALSAIVTVLLTLSFVWASAQGNPPPQGGGGSTSGPIDSGAVALLIGTAAYGYRQVKYAAIMRKSRKSDEVESGESV